MNLEESEEEEQDMYTKLQNRGKKKPKLSEEYQARMIIRN